MAFSSKFMLALTFTFMLLMQFANAAGDANPVYSPCDDAKIQQWDGFTFGVAISTRDSFFFNQTQLSPCDARLALGSAKVSPQLAVYRPKVDEISLLTINTSFSSSFAKDIQGGYMVAFAGRKYAARSLPTFVTNSSYTITSFTLVLEFQVGILQNLYWSKNGCTSCLGKSSYVCLNGQDCAIKTPQCISQGGSDNCDVAIQLAFSGTDKNRVVLNSWYEVSKLQKYSLLNLFANLQGSILR